MKSLIKLPAIALGLFLLITGITQVAKAQYDDVSLQTFYDELSPYGTWINDPEFGYVWRPDVDQSEFRPYYTNGRWVMTEYGNTWVSNYDWGWAPFHYGRWTHNRFNNWVWIPDTVWGPAWVNWRSGGGYYGWAPMAPRVGVHVNLGIVDFWWNFVPYNNIYVNTFPRYYSGRNRVYVQNTIIINNTYVRNNRTYYTGPRVEDIRRHTNQRVTFYNINRSDRAGASRIDRNTVNVYAPRPSRNVDNRSAAPREAISANISRERVESRKTNNVGRENRSSESYNVNNNGRVDRNSNGNVFNRDRERNNSSDTNRGSRIENGTGSENNRPSVFGRSRDRGDATATKPGNTTDKVTIPSPRQERSERSERVERTKETATPRTSESRTSSRSNGQSNVPQRATERPQMQRAERSQSQGSTNRSSNNNSTRSSSRGESSGRPGRG